MNISSSTQDDRRHTEDKLAGILIWIVIAFLVCHFPRILLSFHEMFVIRSASACIKEGKNGLDSVNVKPTKKGCLERNEKLLLIDLEQESELLFGFK